jgi:hypothetical protein
MYIEAACRIYNYISLSAVLYFYVNNDSVQWLRLALSKGPNKVGTCLPSPEDGNRSSFGNVVFSSI